MSCNKKEFLQLVLALLFSSFAFSQPVLIPYRDGKLWGYADSNGVVQIKPAFDKANFFNYSKTITEVFKDNKMSLIDNSGKLLFPFSDAYEQFAEYYIVTQNGKKGIYTKQGVQLIAFEYDNFHHTWWYEKYRNEINKIIANKDSVYYLIDLKSRIIEKIPKPYNSKTLNSNEGIVAEPVDRSDIVSVPYPQLQSSNFSKLKEYSNLVHCQTIYQNGKPVYYLFCSWKDRKMIGYIGQNGVVFYKDWDAHNSELALWRENEYILNFLFAIRLQFQPTNKAEQ